MRRTFSVKVRAKSIPRWGESTNGPERTVDGCTRWPRSSSENTDRADAVTTGWMLSAPVDSGITATDQVQMPGDPAWWDVEGDPLPYESPFTDRRPGTPIALTRTRG